ncbi:MAG: hypothetical protein ACTH31_16475, partial [Pseudoclavibacter sp.]
MSGNFTGPDSPWGRPGEGESDGQQQDSNPWANPGDQPVPPAADDQASPSPDAPTQQFGAPDANGQPFGAPDAPTQQMGAMGNGQSSWGQGTPDASQPQPQTPAWEPPTQPGAGLPQDAAAPAAPGFGQTPEYGQAPDYGQTSAGAPAA